MGDSHPPVFFTASSARGFSKPISISVSRSEDAMMGYCEREIDSKMIALTEVKNSNDNCNKNGNSLRITCTVRRRA